MSKLTDIEKAAHRNIRSGLQYDYLFPSADMLDEVKYRDGNVKDTVSVMQNVVLQYLTDTARVAPKLKGATLEETCRNIWNFVYWHIQYHLDTPGREELRRPARSWHDRVRGVDCDCYSIFISSILTHLGINHAFRVTKYSGDWQHVYVIVPNRNGHYTIDCVTHHFDYEKPYTDKMDYTMTNLNGVPIAVLSGVGSTHDDELFNILSGSDFEDEGTILVLGETDAQKRELDSIYAHLVKTRDYIQANPHSVIGNGGAAAHLQMLNYAIDNWNGPNRDKALDTLEKEEERWNEHNGVSGLGELEEISEDELLGLGKHGQGLKKFWSKVKDATQKIGQGIKNVAKGILKYNPLSIAVRAGYLLAMKLNILDMAAKLYPGYLTEEEAKAKGISSDKWQKSKNAVDKINNLFVNKLHGQADKLKSAIMNGRATRHFAGFGALGEPATITAIMASAIPLAETAKSLTDTGATDSKDDAAKGADTKKGFISKVVEWWKKTFGSKDATAPETVNDDEKAPNESGDTNSGDETAEIDTEQTKTDANGNTETTTWNKIKVFATQNPGTTALGVTAATITILAGLHAMFKPNLNMKTRTQPALSGPSGGSKKKGRKRTSSRRKKIKSINLK